MSDRKFPMYVDIHNKQIVVIGAGKIAERRVDTLLSFCNNIKIIAPSVTPAISGLINQNRVTWLQKKFDENDIKGADIVLAATNDSKVNDEIYHMCKTKNILVNISSDQKKCDFQFPGIINYENVVIGFNSGGEDHKKVRKLRKKVENFLKGHGKENEKK